MINSQIFCSLSSRSMAKLIVQAKTSIIYIAPGIQDPTADAIIALKKARPNIILTVSVDFDEQTLRMGYGNLNAIKRLRQSGIKVTSSAGFRCAILLIDDHGWSFTPTALFLENEPQSDETPNAFVLEKNQLNSLKIRLSPEAKEQAIAQASNEQEANSIQKTNLEVSSEEISNDKMLEVSERIETAPPTNFDLEKQVRVYSTIIQYIELSMIGTEIQRKRIQVPKSLLGNVSQLESLKTTFDLLPKSSNLSSEHLNSKLKYIRTNYTRPLGSSLGIITLKSKKEELQEMLNQLENEILKHQEIVENKIKDEIKKTLLEISEYYLPVILERRPTAYTSAVMTVDKDSCQQWILSELRKNTPKPESLVKQMKLTRRFKDITYETLNDNEFIQAVAKAYPLVFTDKLHQEYLAISEDQTS